MARTELTLSQRWVLAAAVLALGVVATALVLTKGSPLALMQLDSESYIQGLPDRTPGYPLFLALIAAITPNYAMLGLVQYAVLILGTALFCDALSLLVGFRAAGLALALAVFGNYFLMRNPTAIMAETLYLALVLAHYAFVLRAVISPRPLWPLLAGLMLGLAILVRPIGYALVFAVPWLLLAWRARWLSRIALYGAALGAIIVSACVGNGLTRGYYNTQAFGGMSLVLQVATLAPPEVDGFDPVVTRRAYDDLKPIRDAENGAATWDETTLVQILTLNHSRKVFDPPTLAVTANPELWRSASPYWEQLGVNAMAWNFAKKVIRSAPLRYVDRVIHQLYGLWFMTAITDRKTADAVASDLQKTMGWQRETMTDPYLYILPGWLSQARLWIGGAVLLLTLGIVGLSVVRRDPVLAALGYLSASVFTYYGVVAAVGVGLPRYSLMVWPAQCAIVIGILAWGATRWQGGNQDGGRWPSP